MKLAGSCALPYHLLACMAKSQVQVQGKTHASYLTLAHNLHSCPELSGIAIISIGSPGSANILALKVSQSANPIDSLGGKFILTMKRLWKSERKRS